MTHKGWHVVKPQHNQSPVTGIDRCIYKTKTSCETKEQDWLWKEEQKTSCENADQDELWKWRPRLAVKMNVILAVKNEDQTRSENGDQDYLWKWRLD